MKKELIILLMVLSASLLFAQEETLFSGATHHGGYGGPVWKVSSVNGHTAVLNGGRGGWIINHTIALGGGSYRLFSDVESDLVGEADKKLYIDMEYGGFEVEYIHRSDNLVHWTINTLFGGGEMQLREHEPNNEIDNDKFFAVEPSFNVDLNINRWFRIGGGVSYRAIFGLDIEGIEDSELSGPSAGIILKFGSF